MNFVFCRTSCALYVGMYNYVCMSFAVIVYNFMKLNSVVRMSVDMCSIFLTSRFANVFAQLFYDVDWCCFAVRFHFSFTLQLLSKIHLHLSAIFLLPIYSRDIFI